MLPPEEEFDDIIADFSEKTCYISLIKMLLIVNNDVDSLCFSLDHESFSDFLSKNEVII